MGEMHWSGTNAEGELYGFRTIVRPEVIWSWDEVVPRVDTMRMFLECPIKKKTRRDHLQATPYKMQAQSDGVAVYISVESSSRWSSTV